jgi:hypothetical protein
MPEEIMPEGIREGEAVSAVEGGQTGTLPHEIGQPAAPETTREKIEGKYNELLARVVPASSSTVATATPTDPTLDAKAIGSLTDEESKVQKLLDLASTKGVVHAVKVARSLKDYYALDRMHDELSGKLYQGLLERGMITKE